MLTEPGPPFNFVSLQVWVCCFLTLRILVTRTDISQQYPKNVLCGSKDTLGTKVAVLLDLLGKWHTYMCSSLSSKATKEEPELVLRESFKHNLGLRQNF